MSLPSSMADFVPFDRLLQKAYYLVLAGGAHCVMRDDDRLFSHVLTFEHGPRDSRGSLACTGIASESPLTWQRTNRLVLPRW